MTGWTASTGTERALLGGRYELVRHIARGGMGDVFEATDHQLGRQVAVKRFRGSSPQDRPRFDTEVLALARLNHPNLVQVYDSGEHDGIGFLVMELVDGPSLQAILQTRVTLPPTEVASLGASLADALDYVHDKGVVHRDVAPANVLCGEDGRPRLADFGIARLVDTSRITAVATTIGTAAYMAPEQLEGHDVTPAADVYSLGLVLLEALTGRPGFEGTSSEVAVARLVRDPDTTTGVPGEWSELLAWMTARDPASRPTAGRTRDQLAALAAGRPTSALDATGAPAVAGLAATPLVGAASSEAAAPDEFDPLARTRRVPVAGAPVGAVQGGGTAVMPIAVPPEASAGPAAGRAGEPPRPRAARSHRRSPGDPRGRQMAWLIVAGLVVALLIGLASRSSGGSDLPTSTTAVAVEEPAPTTTAAPTTVAPAPQPPPERAEEGNENGKDNGKGNEGNGGEGKGEDKDDD